MKDQLHEINFYANDHFLNTKNGNAINIFHTYIESSKNLRFKDFVRKFIHTLINEHIAVAYNKMGNGEKNLLKSGKTVLITFTLLERIDKRTL